MGFRSYKIGDFIEPYSERCGIPNLVPEQVSGINIDKEFFEPAKQIGEDTSNYKVVPPLYFACNLMHVGRDYSLPIAMNHSGNNKYVSPAYSVFKIKDEGIVLKEYFFILLKSTEKDRYFAFHTDSSIRQGLPWEVFCDIDVTLPSIEQQRKYVGVYLSLQSNLATYQNKIDDLKLVCDGYIDQLKVKSDKLKLGEFIEQCDERNENGEYGVDAVIGISTEKTFIDTKANMNGVSLNSYKIVKKDTFAYVPDTSRRGDKMAIALNRDEKPLLVSSIYTTFRSKDPQKLLPDYLFMFFDRPEFDRYARFNSWGSAREVFTMDDMNDVEIPIPDIKVQQEIVNIHKCYIERQRIASRLKEQLNNLCPILIKGSIETSS